VQFFLGFIHAYTITYVWSLDEFIMTSRRDLTGMMVSKRNHLHLFSGWWTIVIQPDIHIDIRMHIIYLSIYIYIYILYIHIFNFILVVYIYIHIHISTYQNIIQARAYPAYPQVMASMARFRGRLFGTWNFIVHRGVSWLGVGFFRWDPGDFGDVWSFKHRWIFQPFFFGLRSKRKIGSLNSCLLSLFFF